MTKKEFDSLKGLWAKETVLHSLPCHIFGNAAYKAIVAMGKQVIPLILDEMQDMDEQRASYGRGEGDEWWGRPLFWYQALHDITGERPPPRPPVEESDGFVKFDPFEVNKHWLDWAVLYLAPLCLEDLVRAEGQDD